MSDSSERVLVLAVSQRDAESTCEILSRSGISSTTCQSLEELQLEIKKGAGALILAKEALTLPAITSLSAFLGQQPTWSFLPTILLISAGDLSFVNQRILNLLHPLRNMTLLERPIRMGTFLSVVQAALADRKRQYAVRELLQTVEKSKQEAIEASQAKSSFLANMSHEIRTPLGAIIGFSELLTEPGLAEFDKQMYLKTIQRNGKLLTALINDILDLAKVESGRIDLELTDVSIRDLIREVALDLEPQALAQQVSLMVSWGPGVPQVMKLDSLRLKQILINIVGNAIKFTTRGHIKIHLSTGDQQSRSLLEIQVEDTGLGISEKQAANLFQPFSQADSSITRRFGGTGLGLILSKKLANALGGDLQLLYSKLGEGSKFLITVAYVPIEEIHQAFAIQDAQPMDSESKSQILKDRRILVVDDSKDNQVLISRILKISGAQVKIANDGIEAIEKALAEDFDLILMDIQMPRLSGHEATLKLREQGYTKPVIALTAHALQEDRQKCLAAGCNDYLTKPIQRFELLQTIRGYFDS